MHKILTSNSISKFSLPRNTDIKSSMNSFDLKIKDQPLSLNSHITDINCHAWCPELNRVVTAAEIWKILFKDETFDKVPLFQCMEENCRIRLILKTCQPYMMPSEARFRIYSGQSHHHQCAYVHQQRLLKKQLVNQRSQLKREIRVA